MNIKSVAITKCTDCPLVICEHCAAELIPDACPLPDHITQVHARIANEAWAITQSLNQALRESAECSECKKPLTPYRKGTCDDCLVEFPQEIVDMAKECIAKSQERKTHFGFYNNEMLALVPDLINIAHAVIKYMEAGNDTQ